MDEHPQARFIVETLSKAGFIAYYAGGWVRDLLLQHPSDDIDIATNAPPETIQALFPHTIPVGIAFGILIVVIDGHQYEVATFRQDLDYHDGRRPSKIEFTTAIEDAKRRDFTINGMFYDPLQEKILDYVDGQTDLKAKVIRAIGNPHDRIKEDRLRMIRAIRLSCRFGFHIEEKTAAAILAHAEELFPAVAIERVWQELTKGHAFHKLYPMLIKLHEFHLLGAIFPEVKRETKQALEEKLAPIQHYPKKAPLIASLLHLFEGALLAEQIALCKKLKLSKEEQQFVSFLFEAKNPHKTNLEWVQLYADPASHLVIPILAAHLDQEARGTFLQTHEERQKELAPFIQRVLNKNPVITSTDLVNHGISPGKQMGTLLKEAEKIAIDHKNENKDFVITQLKQSSLWPK